MNFLGSPLKTFLLEETKGNTVFLRKKILHKRENGFTMNFQKYRIT